MASELLAALVTFVAVTLFTPGPNNLMLMSSGLNHGFRRSLPHLAGVALGFSFMVLLVGLGIGAVFERWPGLYGAIKWAGIAYLLYLAWTIAIAGPIEQDGGSSGRPITFFEAAAFQWVNPKAWVMAVGAMSTYAAVAAFPFNVGLIVVLFGIIGLASSGAWVAFGQSLRRILASARAVRAFNIAMALGLVASVLPVLMDGR